MICNGESGLNLETGGKERGNKEEKMPFKTHNDGCFNVMYDSGAYGGWRAYESGGYDYAECVDLIIAYLDYPGRRCWRVSHGRRNLQGFCVPMDCKI